MTLRGRDAGVMADLVRLWQAFYSETRTVQKELATLNATIYDQEVRVRELEMELVGPLSS